MQKKNSMNLINTLDQSNHPHHSLRVPWQVPHITCVRGHVWRHWQVPLVWVQWGEHLHCIQFWVSRMEVRVGCSFKCDAELLIQWWNEWLMDVIMWDVSLVGGTMMWGWGCQLQCCDIMRVYKMGNKYNLHLRLRAFVCAIGQNMIDWWSRENAWV